MIPLKDDNPRLRPPIFTVGLIAMNVVAFYFEIQFGLNEVVYQYGAIPSHIVELQNLETLLTSMFLHGGFLHLGGNMLYLWIFGDNIELKFGKIKYLGIYLIWGILAGLMHIMGDPTSITPAVGASGAISGVLGAYLVIFPKARIQTFLMLGFFWRMMHIQARWFLPFWLVFQNLLPFFIGGFGVAGGGVAYLAHIGGFAVGLATGYLYRKTHGSEFMYGTRYGYRPD